MTQQGSTQPTRLLLIRHGESTSNKAGVISGWSTEVTLTELGRLQARRTGEQLKESVAIDALYASPLPRAWETATIIGDVIGLEPVRVDDLREINVGTAVGQPLKDLASLLPLLQGQVDESVFHIAWPGGESHLQLRERAMRAIEAIVRDHPGETVAAVAHGGPLGWIAYSLANDESRPFREWRHQNCAVSEFLIWPQQGGLDARLIRFNDCTHLADDERQADRS